MSTYDIAERWRTWPRPARRAIPAAVIVALIVAGIATHVLQRKPEVYIVLAAILALFFARSAYGGFWIGLDRVGVRNARGRWQRQPTLLQRAVPPLVIAALVILLAWAFGQPPD